MAPTEHPESTAPRHDASPLHLISPMKPGQNGSAAPHPSEPSSAKPVTSPTSTPPYWQHDEDSDNLSWYNPRNSRLIRLEDHTEAGSDQCAAIWANSVRIDDYVVVGGTTRGFGSYVVYNCKVETLNGGTMTLRKRYSDFDKLRGDLVKTFPRAGSSLPPIPPKSILHRFHPKFLEKRKHGLAYFLHCVLVNPEFSSSPVLKDFVFS